MLTSGRERRRERGDGTEKGEVKAWAETTKTLCSKEDRRKFAYVMVVVPMSLLLMGQYLQEAAALAKWRSKGSSLTLALDPFSFSFPS